MNNNVLILLFLMIGMISCQTGGEGSEQTKSEPIQEETNSVPEPEKKIQNTGKAYVYAESGLNLRENPDLKSKVLMVVPFGAQVRILEPASGEPMSVDGLKGGLCKAEYKQTGYLFDGYLGKFPAPGNKSSVESYIKDLEKAGIKAEFYAERLDEDGYIQDSEGLILPTENWQEAFLIAKVLFNIPVKLNMPELKSKENTMVNPDKNENLWSDEVVVNCNNKSEIENIYYYHRGEGGGRTVSIEPAPNGLRIAQTFIVD